MIWCLALVALPVVAGGYAYFGFPLLLWVIGRRPRPAPAESSPGDWPLVTITVPAYNEARAIGGTLDRILEVDYPADRRQVLVISDASTDGTDDIVRRYADRGVELLRLPQRGGKTAAENAARTHIRGEIVVNTDASVRLHRESLKPLVLAFRDPTVGVASGRDVSVARHGDDANVGESGYVGYEMWLRDLETRAGGIVGASGCYYASRRELHMNLVPEALSRDFAAPLVAWEHGYRSVSVNEALGFVPRAGSLRREYRRKVRTMSRGLQTLFHKRHLLNPLRHGRFAWMLFSHKLVRWLVPWTVVAGIAGLACLAVSAPAFRLPVILTIGVATTAAMVAWYWPGERLPRLIATPAYLLWSNLAALHAWIVALRGDLTPAWEPTRREIVET
jgi:cellulose synthase/poly-beta-1,6-N-acetylglucosamine synthase-like glycosyltransferase